MSNSQSNAFLVTLSQVRDGEEIKRVVDEPYYNRMYQEYKHTEEIVKINRSDDLIVTCDYSTKNTWVRGGLTQEDEMCYMFLLYYPRIKELSFCTDMAMFEGAMENLGIGEDDFVSTYGRIGHPDELQIDGQNAQPWLNENMMSMSPAKVKEYEKYLQDAEKNPFCTGSWGNVFSIADHRANESNEGGYEPRAEPEGNEYDDLEPFPEPEPEGGEHGGHMIELMFDAIGFELLPRPENTCLVNFETTTAAQTQDSTDEDKVPKEDPGSTEKPATTTSSAIKTAIPLLILSLLIAMYFL